MSQTKKIKIKTGAKIFIALFICIIIVTTVFAVFFRKKKVSKNPNDILGNSVGNLLNGGDFCEYNGYIYFSNTQDSGKLYRMKTDTTGAVKLTDDTVHNINVYGDYIYYSRKTKNIAGGLMLGIVRCSVKGKELRSLSTDIVSSMVLAGNELYYKGSSDKKVNKTYCINVLNEKKKTFDESAIDPVGIYNRKMYYADPDDNYYIHCYDLSSDSDKLAFSNRAYKVLATNSYTYFIDISDNYSLKRINNVSRDITTLYEGTKDRRCYTFNVYNDMVYYTATDKDGTVLYRMKTNGTGNTAVVTDTIDGIYCTSEYIFATVVNSTKTYQFPTTGSLIVETLKVQ